MEISGNVTDPTKQIPNLYCVPCGRDGLKEAVHGYCQNCQEHLCKICFQTHRRPRPTKDHVLLDKDCMPLLTSPVNTNHDVITDSCTNHTDKPLEFYCNNHKSVACYVCMTLEHKQCKVDYIPDVSGKISEEFKDLIRKMEGLVKKCESNIQKAKGSTKRLDKRHEKVVEEIREFRKEINAHLDEMESKMLKEAKSLVNKAKRKLENVNDACVEITQEVKSSKSLLNDLSEENKTNKLFIEMKKVASRVRSLTDKERQTVEDNMTDDSIEFVGNKKMLDLLKAEKGFGEISTCKKPTPESALCLQYDRDINLKLSSDMKRSDCCGIVMISTTRIIVADLENEKIKLIDVLSGAVLSEETLFSAPFDIIILANNKLAVALFDESCIQIMSYTDTSVSLDRRINVGGKCSCVAYCQDKLVGGCFYPEKLVIMDLDGNITRVFDTSGFDGPLKIIISSDEKFLYISDYHYFSGKSRLIKMDWEGKIVQTWQETEYVRPVGIQDLEDDTLLVCYRDKIVRLSGNFERCEIKGLEESFLYNLWSVAYSENNHKLYVSCLSEKTEDYSDTIKIFHVKWM